MLKGKLNNSKPAARHTVTTRPDPTATHHIQPARAPPAGRLLEQCHCAATLLDCCGVTGTVRRLSCLSAFWNLDFQWSKLFTEKDCVATCTRVMYEKRTIHCKTEKLFFFFFSSDSLLHGNAVGNRVLYECIRKQCYPIPKLVNMMATSKMGGGDEQL